LLSLLAAAFCLAHWANFLASNLLIWAILLPVAVPNWSAANCLLEDNCLGELKSGGRWSLELVIVASSACSSSSSSSPFSSFYFQSIASFCFARAGKCSPEQLTRLVGDGEKWAGNLRLN